MPYISLKENGLFVKRYVKILERVNQQSIWSLSGVYIDVQGRDQDGCYMKKHRLEQGSKYDRRRRQGKLSCGDIRRAQINHKIEYRRQ